MVTATWQSSAEAGCRQILTIFETIAQFTSPTHGGDRLLELCVYLLKDSFAAKDINAIVSMQHFDIC